MAEQICETNFECQNTGCCKDKKCVDISECYDDVKLMYLIVGIIAAIFLLVVIIYFIVTILKIRQNVRKIDKQNKLKESEFKNEKDNNNNNKAKNNNNNNDNLKKK